MKNRTSSAKEKQMKNRTMLPVFFLAVIGVVLSSATMRADVVTLSTGTPAPSLSPVLNYDVNFDHVATGSLITPTEFASQGIASITNAGSPLYTAAGSQSLPNYVGTLGGDGWAMDTTITFNALQSEVGFGDAGPNNTTLSAYGNLGNLLFTSTFPTANAYFVLTDSTAADISSIVISSSFIAIDDVQFNNISSSSATPEPESLVMVGTGLLGLIGVARRKFAL